MQGLQQEMQNGAEQLKLHIDNTLQEPWDQKPIQFQDAIGRRYPVPLEICGTFEVCCNNLGTTLRLTIEY
jgi:hypothetical protein